MAFKQLETTRWIARVGTWIATVGYFVLEILKSFLNFKEEDNLFTKGIKTTDLAIRRVAYFVADYGLTVVSVGIFATMKTLEFSFLGTFLALWSFDFVVAGSFIVFYEKTGKDLSLGEDFRRATDTIHKRSQLAGYGVALSVIVLAIVWTGPEKVITFFRKEIETIPRIIVVLLILTAIQSFIWTILYGFGSDILAKLF